jgi:hypothetical protein
VCSTVMRQMAARTAWHRTTESLPIRAALPTGALVRTWLPMAPAADAVETVLVGVGDVWRGFLLTASPYSPKLTP